MQNICDKTLGEINHKVRRINGLGKSDIMRNRRIADISYSGKGCAAKLRFPKMRFSKGIGDSDKKGAPPFSGAPVRVVTISF